MLTTPQPTWVQGATGDIGVVPEVGSQVEKLGYHADFDTHFVRIEGTYMDFDGVTLTSSTNSDNTVTLKSLDGVTGKISVGMSF